MGFVVGKSFVLPSKNFSGCLLLDKLWWASKEVDVEVPADDDESSDEDEKRTINFITYVTFVKLLQ